MTVFEDRERAERLKRIRLAFDAKKEIKCVFSTLVLKNESLCALRSGVGPSHVVDYFVLTSQK